MVRLLAVAGFVLLVLGHVWGLAWAPPEATMGETGRILYLHVPTAWTAMGAYGVAVIASVAALWSGSRRADGLVGPALEVGVVLNGLMIVQGALWAYPTWGVWTGGADPRFLTTLAAFVLFGAVLALRRVVAGPRRLVASGVGVILVSPILPLIQLAPRLWRTIHPSPSRPDDITPEMWPPLALSAVGLGLLAALRILVSDKDTV